MTATVDRLTDRPKDQLPANIPDSPRDRLKRGRPLRYKDVETPSMGRFRVRELKQWEKDEADAPVMQSNGDGKGNVTQRFDSRGHRTRLIAFALINDDGSNVYADPMGDGAKDVGELPRVEHDLLWKGVDELNPTTAEAHDALGKGSAKATT